jgi:hypothetical protein
MATREDPDTPAGAGLAGRHAHRARALRDHGAGAASGLGHARRAASGAERGKGEVLLVRHSYLPGLACREAAWIRGRPRGRPRCARRGRRRGSISPNRRCCSTSTSTASSGTATMSRCSWRAASCSGRRRRPGIEILAPASTPDALPGGHDPGHAGADRRGAGRPAPERHLVGLRRRASRPRSRGDRAGACASGRPRRWAPSGRSRWSGGIASRRAVSAVKMAKASVRLPAGR